MGPALGSAACPSLFHPVINLWSDVWVIDKLVSCNQSGGNREHGADQSATSGYEGGNACLLEDIASGGCTDSDEHVDCGTRHIAVVVDTAGLGW